MSTSIYGTVEVKLFNDGFDDWFSVIDSGAIVTGNYDFFGCLFGVRNPSNFEALFPNRGLPEGCSEEVQAEFSEGDYKDITWCSYSELIRIDLSEKALAPDQRVLQEYEGRMVKAYAENDEQRAKAKTMTRAEALNEPGFILLMELMAVLAKKYGDESVRWVVSFD